MSSIQFDFDHQGTKIINDELIISWLEEESPVDNHSSINEEEEEKLNRVIRSLEVEINMSSPTIDQSRKSDLQQTKPGLDDGFEWLNDFDIGMSSLQNDDEMMNWCAELSYMDDVVNSNVIEIQGGDYYSHINYQLTTFEESTISLWQERHDVIMY